MSGRCKACNCILNEDELAYKYPGTSEYTELCFSCMAKSDDDYEPDDYSQQLELFEDE